jgi:integrase
MAARTKHRLTAREALTLTTVGRHADGGNLYLSITPSGGRRWVFLYSRRGHQREMGLGPAPGPRRAGLSLQDARAKAEEAWRLLQSGKDPIETKRTEQEVPTFGEFADKLLAKLAPGMSKMTAWQWKQSIEKEAAELRPLPVNQITMTSVLRVLEPIWETKSETATRLRYRIERVLDAAKARGYRTGDNPAAWRGNLKTNLPEPTNKEDREHHAAMPYKDVPDFIVRLRAKPQTSASALEFIILTATRKGETLGARWQEIDMETRTWTIPRERMKGKPKDRVAHTVPLTDQMIAVLNKMKPEGYEPTGDAFVFPGMSVHKPLGHDTLRKLCESMKLEATVHGFRSSFRVWAAEKTDFLHEICEAALAHKTGNKVTRAYQRSHLFDKRRELMQAWDAFLTARR